MTYADHVVVVTAVDETELTPTAEEREIGEGYVPRRVSLQVDRTIWSNDTAERPAPKGTFEWEAWGWAFTGDERTPMLPEDQPRIEVGHTYIVAITWQPAVDDESGQVPAGWTGLGADAIVPYDDGVIGRGELSGQVQPAATPLDASDPNASLEDQLAGEDVDALAAALASA